MTGPGESTCPACGTSTEPFNGHRTLCFDCTLDELGETFEALQERSAATARKAAQRIFQGKAKT